MKSIYLIENNTPVVAIVTMEKPIIESVNINKFELDNQRYLHHLTTATKHEVIGKVPKEWVVGELVEVELQKQWWMDIGEYWKDCDDYVYTVTGANRRIVAKPLSLNLPNLEDILNNPNSTLEKEVTALMDKLDEDNKPIPVGEEKKYPIGGYAPGNYMCKCCICKDKFMGDKRAVQCEPCAEKMVSEYLPSPPVKQETEDELWKEVRNILNTQNLPIKLLKEKFNPPTRK